MDFRFGTDPASISVLTNNLTQTGVALIQRDISISGALVSLISASAAGVGALNGLSGLLTLAGSGSVSITTNGQSIIISGSATGGGGGITQGQLDSLSGWSASAVNLTSTGINLLNIIYGGDTNISGNLTTTGTTLRNFAIGGDTNLSGNLTTTGTTLRNLAIGGDTNLSGNMTTTGINLGAKIDSLSGWSASSAFAIGIGTNLSGNLTTTGQTLRNLSVGIGTIISGNLTTTGQTLWNSLVGGDTNTSGSLSTHAGLTTTAHGGIVASNDSRLSDPRPASDVYSWAKAATKPTYTYTEVGADAAGAAAAITLAGLGGVPTSRQVAGHALTDNITLSKGDVGLGSVDNTADSAKSVNYATTAGGAPASDVYSWAKAASKPSYTYTEVGADAAGAAAAITLAGLGGVPTSRTVNSKALTGDVSFTASEIGGISAGMLKDVDLSISNARIAGRTSAGAGRTEEITIESPGLGIDSQNLHLAGIAKTFSNLANAAGILNNDGAGVLSYRAITVSTSDPGGTPANGDLWIKYVA
jgi:hypothetical protein